jgi:hypothetical protein
MNMKKVIYLLLLISNSRSFAQDKVFQNRLQGSLITKFSISSDTARIIKLDSGSLANQTVRLVDWRSKKSYTAYTDQQGKYFFEHVDAGKYFLYVDEPELDKQPILVSVYAPRKGLSKVKPILVDRIAMTVRVLK